MNKNHQPASWHLCTEKKKKILAKRFPHCFAPIVCYDLADRILQLWKNWFKGLRNGIRVYLQIKLHKLSSLINHNTAFKYEHLLYQIILHKSPHRFLVMLWRKEKRNMWCIFWYLANLRTEFILPNLNYSNGKAEAEIICVFSTL